MARSTSRFRCRSIQRTERPQFLACSSSHLSTAARTLTFLNRREPCEAADWALYPARIAAWVALWSFGYSRMKRRMRARLGHGSACLLIAQRLVLRCVESERIIGIAGIDEIGTARAEQLLYFLDRLADHAARLARLNLALELDERPIGAVESPRQDCCDVKERDRILHERGGCTGDVKLGVFQRTYVCRVRLI